MGGDKELIKELSRILGAIKTRPSISKELYSNESNLDVGQRMGPAILAPEKILLTQPPPTDDLGITGVYAAVSAFNAFFKPAFYEEAVHREEEEEDIYNDLLPMILEGTMEVVREEDIEERELGGKQVRKFYKIFSL